MKCLSILGSTGSIGVQTLEIVRLHPHRFRVAGLAGGANLNLLEDQIREFRPEIVSCSTPQGACELKRRMSERSQRPWIGHSVEGLEAVATAEQAEIVVVGLPGSSGLRPSFAAVHAGKDLALATKEVLVMAGKLFMETVANRHVNLLPVDSEQSAIFQCLQGNHGSHVRRIILTASGGPFRDLPDESMALVTKKQALNHPRWKMGPKVTIDSATLMNKGLEVIEARWLFSVPSSLIEVVIHPQSIIHSMLEFDDGSILAQLGVTDMKLPISYALAFPERIESGTARLSLPELGSLTFRSPDMQKFPLLRAAYEAAVDDSNALAIIMNASDEVAVDMFLGDRVSFSGIPRIVLDAMESIPLRNVETLEEIVAFHEEVVEQTRRKWTPCPHS
jgi:1-deoxy-D-xylulose-5-phosphate reductoisomerase